jgi:ABC-type nitrate/sulfonate/bicarbonate transport system permease component
MPVQASKADIGLVRDGHGWRVAQKIWWRVEPLVRRSAAIVIFLLLWELAPRLGLFNRTLLPQRDRVSGAGAAA